MTPDHHTPLWQQRELEHQAEMRKLGASLLRAVVMFAVLITVAYKMGVIA
jgi:hypothetical protein